jgi:hypothetical protein
MSFVSCPIIFFNGVHRFGGWAFIVVGLSSEGFFVRGHSAARSVILMPPAMIESILTEMHHQLMKQPIRTAVSQSRPSEMPVKWSALSCNNRFQLLHPSM